MCRCGEKRSESPSSIDENKPEEQTEQKGVMRYVGPVTAELVYSAPGYIQLQCSQRAAAILKRSLELDSIMFDIPNTSLDHVTVVDQISKQLGALAGYTNINDFRQDSKNLHLEIVFQSEESSKAAIEKGVTIDGIVSKGMPWIDSIKKTTIKVSLSQVTLTLYKTLGEDLRLALTPYGDVKQVRKYADCNGHWFGKASVIIDRADEDNGEHVGLPELSRMIYL